MAKIKSKIENTTKCNKRITCSHNGTNNYAIINDNGIEFYCDRSNFVKFTFREFVDIMAFVEPYIPEESED